MPHPSTTRTYGGLLPSDLDSSTPPPSGAPNYLIGVSATSGNTLDVLQVPRRLVDTGEHDLRRAATRGPVAPFNLACGGGTCIPQSGTTQKLDSLGDRLMYRLAYRNFGDHESLVVNHTVKAGTATGVRWYEVARPERYADGRSSRARMGPPTASTGGWEAPRWTRTATSPSATASRAARRSRASRYTGRLAGDALGTMTQGETVMKAGAGSQKSDINVIRRTTPCAGATTRA